jgi:hypothetical protein
MPYRHDETTKRQGRVAPIECQEVLNEECGHNRREGHGYLGTLRYMSDTKERLQTVDLRAP